MSATTAAISLRSPASSVQPVSSSKPHRRPSISRSPLVNATTAVITASALALATAASATGAGPALAAAVTHANAAPCKPSISRIEGGPAVNYCGPATATLRVAGKTYTFSHGVCQSTTSFEDVITLGTFAKGKNGSGTLDNGGKPYFSLDLGRGESSYLNLTYFGGNLLSAEGSVSFRGRPRRRGPSSPSRPNLLPSRGPGTAAGSSSRADPGSKGNNSE